MNIQVELSYRPFETLLLDQRDGRNNPAKGPGPRVSKRRMRHGDPPSPEHVRERHKSSGVDARTDDLY